MDPDYRYTAADEDVLDALLSGQEAGDSVSLASVRQSFALKSGLTGVIWVDDTVAHLARPLALVVHEDLIRRLCGRYAQLRSDFSPLTSWCHLLTPKILAPMDAVVRTADLKGMEAAWVGLAVAEAMLSAEKPLPGVRISACLATQSFSIGRANSLWYGITTEEVLRRFDIANQSCRNERPSERREGRTVRLRTSLQPVWTILTECLYPELPARSPFGELVQAVQALRDARRQRQSDESRLLVRPLLEFVPEFKDIENLAELTPELRLRMFDRLVMSLSSADEHGIQRRTALAFLAGYIATVAAGGSPSLTLAESHASRWPEITAWAYVVGGLGEKVLWTSAFDGLGRLVARELLRPFRLDEPPTCDFSFDELSVLIDPALKDPLVNLRIKQARSVTVALLPGVNAAIPLADQSAPSATRNDSQRLSREDPAVGFADAVWPHLRNRLDEYFRSCDHQPNLLQSSPQSAPRKRSRKKAVASPQLPLAGEQEKQ